MKYKNSPICEQCGKDMNYLFTDIARWKSVWKCRDCDTRSVTNGYPDEDDDPPRQTFPQFKPATMWEDVLCLKG